MSCRLVYCKAETLTAWRSGRLVSARRRLMASQGSLPLPTHIFQHILQPLVTYPSYPVSLEHTLFFNLLDIPVIFDPSPFPHIVT